MSDREPISGADFVRRHEPMTDAPRVEVVDVSHEEVVRMRTLLPRSVFDRSQLDGLAFGVVASWVLLAFTRLGGQFLTDPSAGLRFVLVGLWGWLATAAVLCLGVNVIARRVMPTWQAMAVTGAAQLGLIAVGFVTFMAGNAMQLLGPGWFAAVVAGLGWMPYALVAGVRQTSGVDWLRSAAIGIGVQLLWLVTVGRYVVDRLDHLF